MAKTNSKEVLKKAEVSNAPMQQAAKRTVGGLIQAMLDSENLRSRFQELLGARMPQFIGSIISMVNEDPYLKEAFFNAPMTVLQSAMRAAAYNLPIDKTLGFAYVVPYWNGKTGRREAQFVLGYKGMIQLANRTGAYERLNVVEVKDGELKSFDRLTEDVEMNWVVDDARREKLPTIGYLGYFRLINGFEKRIYFTVDKINAHEKKHRQGKEMSWAWKNHFDSMSRKTVLREMVSKWGLMSIDYQKADARTIQIAHDIAAGTVDDELTIDAPVQETPAQLPEQTGEVQQTVPEGTVQEMFMGEPVPADQIVDF